VEKIILFYTISYECKTSRRTPIPAGMTQKVKKKISQIILKISNENMSIIWDCFLNH